MVARSRQVVHLVRPEVPFETTIPLTIADVALVPPVNSRYLLVYKDNDCSSDSRKHLVSRLLLSLQSLLRMPEEGVIAVPEILGKIHPGSNPSGQCIQVNESSAVRVVISYRDDITYKSLAPEKGLPQSHMKGKIFARGLPAYATPGHDGGLEGFSVQVTFISGGFVICVSKHHWVLDGTAFSRLIKWWFAKARSIESEKTLLDSDLLPASQTLAIHDRSSLTNEVSVEPKEHIEWKVVPNNPPSVFGIVPPSKTLLSFVKYMAPFLKPKINNSIFKLSPAALEELRNDVTKHSPIRLSTNDLVCALLWRCVTRARLYDRDDSTYFPEDNSKSSLALAVNARSKVSPPMSTDYIGNCVFFAPSRLPLPILTAMGAVSLANVAGSIRESISDKTSNDWHRSVMQLAAAQRKPSDMVMAFNFFMGKDLMITSWERYFESLDDLDVGQGFFRALRLPDGGTFDGMAMILPAYGRRDRECWAGGSEEYAGGLEISLDLLEGPMESLKKDLEWLRYATCDED